MTLAEAVVDQHLGFLGVFHRVVHAEPEGVELRPQVAGEVTFLGHFLALCSKAFPAHEITGNAFLFVLTQCGFRNAGGSVSAGLST
jgi:hypothetical protein